MKYTLGAVIPTVQYGNLQPEIELEGDNFKELTQEAEAYIQEIWDKYGERPLKTNTSDAGYEGHVLETVTGEKIVFYDKGDDHYYTDMEGNVLLSGSKYAAEISPKFDRGAILPKTAKAWDVPEDALGHLWDMAGTVSNHYGSAVHKAIETYLLYREVGEQIMKQKELEFNYALPKNPILRASVLSFVEAEKDLLDSKEHTLVPEAVVSDVKNKRAGQVDLLVYNADTETYQIYDFKTNHQMDKKKLLQYQHQLSFYAHVLNNMGLPVDSIVVYHLEEENWVKHELEVLDLQV